MWWSVFVKAQGEDPRGGVVTTERLEAFAERLLPHHGVVGGGRGAYDAQLSLEGDDLAGVVTAALAVFAEARAAVGLPAWPYVELTAKTEAALDAELAEPPPFPEVVGATEAARMLGVSRQRLYQLAEREDFPPPMVQLAAGPVWLTDSIRAFEGSWDRRPGRRARAG
jgi:predicted DNA-binding transcriptional regulator AlpA